MTLHYMTEQADAGDIIAQRPVDIAFEDTALTLFEKVAQAAVELFPGDLPPHQGRARPAYTARSNAGDLLWRENPGRWADCLGQTGSWAL